MHKPSERGLTGSTATVLDDITSVLKSLLPFAAETSTPLFLMGHSMGGAEILQYAARGPPELRSQIRGYVAVAPYLALHPSSQPSRALVIAGRLASKMMPVSAHTAPSLFDKLSSRVTTCTEVPNLLVTRIAT